MATPTTNLVARLQLRAEQFSSETGQRFAELTTRAKSAAAETRDAFGGAFAEVNKLAKQALTIPRTTAGGLDLSGEIATLNAAAEAADRQAAQLRELSIAQSAVAASGRGDAEALRLEADASAVAALASEQAASAARGRIVALQAVQVELDNAARASGQLTIADHAAAAAQAELAGRAQALRDALNPVAVAQRQHNAEVAEARTLLNAGAITADEFAAAETRAASALRQVADAAGVAAEKQAELWREQAAAARQDVAGRQFQNFATPALSGKSAAESAAVFQEQERLADVVKRYRAELDPAAAAQDRLNAELIEARAAFAAAGVSGEELARVEAMITARGGQMVGGLGQRRAGLQQLSYQMNDAATMFSMGARAEQVFVSQSGQIIQALQLMSGAGGGVLGWLGSWQGMLITTAAVALTPFIAKLLAGGDALADETEKLRRNAESAELAEQAKKAFASTEAGLSEQVRKLTADIHDQNDALLTNAERMNIASKNSIEKLQAKRRDILSDIGEAQQDIDAAKTAEAAGATGALARAEAFLATQRARLTNNTADLAAANAALVRSRADLAGEEAKRATSPTIAIERKYDGLIEAAKKRAVAEGWVTSELTRQLTVIERNRAAAIKAAQDAANAARQKPKVVSLGDQVDTAQSSALFKDAVSFRGQREGSSVLGDLFKQANINVDPKITAWCAAFVNAVLATNGLPQTNSLAARSFLGYGTATDKPQVGDIVVSKRGDNPAQGHVGFYQGTDRAGNVQVLGGNTADKVGTRTVAKTDILGFRRAPTAAETYKADTKGIAAAETDAEKLARFLDQSSESIARISTGFGVAETTVRRATLATQALNGEIADLSKRKIGLTDPEALASINKQIAAAQAAKGVVAQSLDRPVQDFIEGQRQAFEIGQLVLGGQQDQAEALRTINQLERDRGPLTQQQKDAILATTQALRAQGEQIEVNRQRQQAYLGVVDDVRQSIVQTITDGSVEDLPKRISEAFRRGAAEMITENLFGDTFRKLKDQITGTDRVGDAAGRMAGAVDQVTAKTNATAAALEQLGSAAGSAAGALTDRTGTVGGAPAVDGLTQLLARGNGAPSPVDLLSVPAASPDLATLFGKGNGNPLPVDLTNIGQLTQASDRTSDAVTRLGVKIPKGLQDILGGVGYGQLGGGIFSSITGKKGDGTASAIGGVLGQEAGKALGKLVPQAATGLLKSLGGAAGPIGAVVGGVLGPLIAGLFTKPKFGTSVITNTTSKPTASAGNSDAAKSGATSLGGAVQQGLQQIADALDGELGAFRVSIGTFDGKYRVSGTGFTGSLDSKNAAGQDLHNFGTDGQNEAIAYAISDALMDGAILGISQASKNILGKATSDGLQKALEKALLIEAIPRDLKAMLDPVGAAIDDLNRKWEKTVAALKEGGASAEQMTQAQQLYNLQLDQVKANTASASAGLKDFMTSLKLGNASPLSLRDQEAAAVAALKPYLDTIDAGGRVDQGKYQSAAQAYLDVERELYGSTAEFFAAFDKVQASTAKAIAAIDNAVPITPGVADPFAQATATNTATAASGIQTGNELLSQLSGTMLSVQQLLQSMASGGGGGSLGGFIGAQRSF